MAQSRTGSAVVGVLVVIVACFALAALFSIRIVGAGEVGVIHVFGEVDKSPRPSGLLFKLPWASMETMNVRTQQLTMSSASEDVGFLAGGTVNTLTSEGLTVGVDLTIFYHLDFSTAPEVFRELGPAYEAVVLLPAVRGAIRDVVAQFSAEDLYTVARGAVGDLILSNLVRDLETRGIVAEQVLLRDITLPSQLRQQIENKLAEEQRIQEEEFRKERQKIEAERVIIDARAQQEKQQLINSTLTPEFLKFQYIESLANMEGGNIIYVPISPGTGLPVFLDLGLAETTTAP